MSRQSSITIERRASASERPSRKREGRPAATDARHEATQSQNARIRKFRDDGEFAAMTARALEPVDECDPPLRARALRSGRRAAAVLRTVRAPDEPKIHQRPVGVCARARLAIQIAVRRRAGSSIIQLHASPVARSSACDALRVPPQSDTTQEPISNQRSHARCISAIGSPAKTGRIAPARDRNSAESSYRMTWQCCVFSPQASHMARVSSSFSRECPPDCRSISTPSPNSSSGVRAVTAAAAAWRSSPTRPRFFPACAPAKRLALRSRC